MQVPLYEAVIAVGRMAEDVRKYGWACGMLGNQRGPKCVNGGLTIAMGAHCPRYISEYAHSNREIAPAIRLASVALIQTLDEDLKARLSRRFKRSSDVGDRKLARALHAALTRPQDEHTFETLESVLFQANDESRDTLEPYLDAKSVLAWYERAQDKLAEGLPEPIPATPPLTVEQILSTMPVIA